ncbi:hypothetical protein C8R45DRAFT_1154572 [Mycena sanguinolenta]|nr:hypothetical protein C8R45DRAFT_1154572 [Mycena sanguinolenta]
MEIDSPNPLPDSAPLSICWPIPTKQDGVWYLPPTQYINKESIMIRDEYRMLLAGILEWQNLRHITPVDSNTTSLCDPRRIRAIAQDIESMSEQQFPSLFVDQLDAYRQNTLLVMTGLPGIGKTMFLRFIFHLRVTTRLPTLYMENNSFAIVFVPGNTWKVPATALFDILELDLIPTETWCLIDCNPEFHAIPTEVVRGPRFVMLAASPRNVPSVKDFATTRYCVMRPWTLQELCDGLQFQTFLTSKRPNPRNLEEFFDRFGGSARLAYQKSADPQSIILFEANTRKAARNLDSMQKTLIRSLFTTAKIIDLFVFRTTIPDEISHILLSVFPIDDLNRTRILVDAPSQAMASKALEILATDLETARQEFWNLLHLNTPNQAARGWASTVFNRFYHDVIVAGGMWQLQPMDETSRGEEDAVYAATDVEKATSLLFAHSRLAIVTNGSIHGTPVSLSTVRLPEEGEDIAEADVYYIPYHTNFPVFNSLYVVKPHHAIGFQASIAVDGQPIKVPDVAWLRAHNIKKVSYILVTPEKLLGRRHVTVPPQLAGTIFDKFYHLPLPF